MAGWLEQKIEQLNAAEARLAEILEVDLPRVEARLAEMEREASTGQSDA